MSLFIWPGGIRTRKGVRRQENSRGLFLGGRSKPVAQAQDGRCDRREADAKSLLACQKD
jgi:hypothetical protein